MTILLFSPKGSPGDTSYRDTSPMCMLADFDCAARFPHTLQRDNKRQRTVGGFDAVFYALASILLLLGHPDVHCTISGGIQRVWQ